MRSNKQKTQEIEVEIRVGRKLILGMGLPAHDLIAQFAERLLGCSKSLVPVMDGRPQRLDLSTGARESLVSRLDGLLQCHDLVLQGLKASGHQPDLDVEGITLAADKGDVLLKLLHTRQ
jgi:hypothetical protein